MAAEGNSRAVTAGRDRVPHASYLYVEVDVLRPVDAELAVSTD